MKQSIIFSFLTLLLLFSCRKEDNPQMPDVIGVPLPLLTKVATTDQAISAQNPAAFKGSFVVDVYFKQHAPQKFDIVVMRNGEKGSAKKIQENVTTFPTTVEITGQQLAALFNTTISAGDSFDFGADVTANGQTFQAFPLVGEPYGSGVANLPGSSTRVKYVSQ